MELAPLQCLLTMILHWTALYWPADQWCFWKIIRSHSVPCYDRCIEVSSACVSVIFTNEIRRYAAVQRLRQDMNFVILVAPSNFLWLFSLLLARTIGNVYRRAISDKQDPLPDNVRRIVLQKLCIEWYSTALRHYNIGVAGSHYKMPHFWMPCNRKASMKW
jgi:hypothetical protein